MRESIKGCGKPLDRLLIIICKSMKNKNNKKNTPDLIKYVCQGKDLFKNLKICLPLLITVRHVKSKILSKADHFFTLTLNKI